MEQEAKKSRRLWLEADDISALNNNSKAKKSKDLANTDTYDTIFERFSSRPASKPLTLLASNAFVVGQEFILTCLLLASHRAAISKESSDEDDVEANTAFEDPLMQFLILIWFTFFLVVLHNKSTYYSDAPGVLRKTKVRHRLTDAIFMAILLRFLAAVLKTLTASYSSDTVDTLAMASLLLHLLACDYPYANGFSSDGPIVDAKKRPTFQGGTLSLTAAFFATTLLASRLESNAAVYIFVSFSVILFALYPAARHQVAINTKTNNRWGAYYYCVHSIPLSAWWHI
jgi:phosphatidylinositol glycan class C protein